MPCTTRAQVTLTRNQPVTIKGNEPGHYDQIPSGNMYGAKYIPKGTKVFLAHEL